MVINTNANVLDAGNVPLLVAYAYVNYPFQTFNSVFIIFFSVFKSCYPCLCTWSQFMVYVSFTDTYCFLIISKHRTIKQVWSCTLLHGKKSINFPMSSAWKFWYFHQFNALSPTFYWVSTCTNVLSKTLFFYQKGCHSWEAGMAHSRAVLTEEFADKGYALMCFSQSYALQPNLWSGCSSEVWRNLSGCCE